MTAKRYDENDAIRRLLILLLFKLGATSQEVGMALGLHESRIRQLLPVSRIKKIELLR